MTAQPIPVIRDGRRPGAVPVAELLARAGAVARARGAELWAAE
ncbi:hypothetical protein OG866_21115 [Streptomyces sp. NBC_00663]|nr:hypothetical protein [Streptomyces sp. NBC_00663]